MLLKPRSYDMSSAALAVSIMDEVALACNDVLLRRAHAQSWGCTQSETAKQDDLQPQIRPGAEPPKKCTPLV